ncbi:hypothetical protein FZC76_21835 [Sutcliffiella horikoshii]|uniref:Phage protein n=1 Tax=Sutcliffiella horikoshii TaxID=79883 RepID=A0A5D4SEW6_9BACI|nr:hypothetical protein [Sutcliffiella horikoshii]TYS60512.1 hypothetical protein FZC76_21835 [Sutcliffiella horikoshii]
MKTENQVTTTENQVAVSNNSSNYISVILEETKQGFLEANSGLDLDFVRMGDWLKISKKGNFIEKDNEEVSYGDRIDVVVGHGEKRYTLWGKDNTPEKGQIITMEQTQEEAEQALAAWLEENPEAAERYTFTDIDLRYLAYVVPVSSIADSAKSGDLPDIYLMSFPKGDTIGWGKYAMSLFKGKHKGLGIPKGTGANRVVTRLVTEERENKDKESYLGIKFEPVGLFVPSEYGIEA